MSEFNTGGQIETRALDLGERVAELADAIREYSHSQVESWKQIPYLALQAEGRRGFSSDWKLYRYGLLHLHDGSSQSIGLFGTFVDCATGRIISQAGKFEPDYAARDENVIKVFLSSPEQFDAHNTVEAYRLEAEKPQSSHTYTPESVEAWRLRVAATLSLKESFERAEYGPGVDYLLKSADDLLVQ